MLIYSWDAYSLEFLEKARVGSIRCQVCHGQGFLGDGTCNCCAAGAWARKLLEEENLKSLLEKLRR